MLRNTLAILLRLLFRVEVHGAENARKAGKRVLIIANHQSFLDALLLAVFLPEKPMFAINTHIAQQWWIKPFLKIADTFALDPTSPMATKRLIDEIKQDRKCVIFPEGRITVTGSLMKIYNGPALVADKSDAMLLPVRIEGAQYTYLSKLGGKQRRRLLPKITLSILAPRKFEIDAEIKGRKRRELAGKKLYDVMSDTQFATSPWHRTVFQSMLDAMVIHGPKHIVCEDINRKPLRFRMLIARSLILGRKLAEGTQRGEAVGLLLPSANATLIAFLGLHAFGRVPAMLNFSAGPANITSACKTAVLKQVYTSRAFIEKGKLDALIPAIAAGGAKLHYLEDLAPTVSPLHKLRGLLTAYTVCLWRGRLDRYSPDDSAVILFTSGSEGAPKGVVLSHANLMANRHQVAARIAFGPQDIVFNAMPLFHSFGLTGATLLPITAGARVFFYPSPLHYRIVPELTYDTDATILFGTDTFLAGYAKFANPYDFYRVRFAVTGAEKLKDETRRVYSEKYGVRVLEGYGATETAPVISVNTLMQNRPGTVGRLLPGIQYRLEPMPGVDEGGRLQVRGPNVMRGYLLADKPGVLQPISDGWYDTGDIVKVDEEGYVTILGRAKRFAKIGGEMVSLAAVEQYLSALWPDSAHAVVTLPDEKKGEQIWLLTEKKGATRSAIAEYAREHGIHDLSIPKTVKVIDKLPLLGTGKVDYPAVQKLVSTGEIAPLGEEKGTPPEKASKTRIPAKVAGKKASTTKPVAKPLAKKASVKKIPTKKSGKKS